MRKLRYLAAVVLAALMLAGAAAGQGTFTDVAPNDWYYKAVTEMAQEGLLSGYPDGSFRPDEPISAAELVVVAAQCAGLTPVQGQCSHWASGAMQAALQAGWYDWDEIPPTGETFDRPISRQVAVKIVMKALLPAARGDFATETAKMRDFSDLDGRYYDAAVAAYAAGVVSGDDTGRFHPKDSLSRAEACSMARIAQLRAAQDPAAGQKPEQTVPQPSQPEVPQPVTAVRGGVSENGWLQVIGTQLCNEQGEAVVLRGMSSHGLQWYGQFAGETAIQNTAAYGANVFRLAMYTGENGYLSQPEAIQKKVTDAIAAAIRQDMYVILDWHILSDGNPMTNADQAEAFFTQMAKRYADTPNVIYELCNEPNGNVSWSRDVKPYAQRLVGVIREQSPKAVILIGSPTWSQDIHLAAADPVEGENLMYTLHFYAGTHGEDLRRRIDDAMDKGLAVFISEWGTSRADGSGGVFLEQSRVWLDFLDQRGISWCNWSLCDKNETSAALKPGTSPDAAWGESDLTESGKFVFSRFSS